jgi:hypothetical protein
MVDAVKRASRIPLAEQTIRRSRAMLARNAIKWQLLKCAFQYSSQRNRRQVIRSCPHDGTGGDGPQKKAQRLPVCKTLIISLITLRSLTWSAP